MEAVKNGTTSQAAAHLIPCPQCNLSFACSPAHWAAARALHDAPCEDGHDGLSHCDLNREVRGDVKFQAAMAGEQDGSGDFIWAPDRVKAAWNSLDGKSWEEEFGAELRASVGVPVALPMAPWIRAVSDTLTMTMTILHALEVLNDGDDSWTRKHTLTVHVRAPLMFLLFLSDPE
jgi:splicing suppressor protein 51